MPTATELMKQAMMTAHDYMIHAEADIDGHFGAGFAKANPALMAAYMQAAALDYATSFGLQGISAALDRAADALDEKSA